MHVHLVMSPPGYDTAWATLRGGVDLPVLPDVTEQVLRLANDVNCSLQSLATLISRDPATAAHVMRLANSPLYRGREPIVTLHQAAARLGVQRLRDVAVIVASESRLFRARGFEAEARHAFTHGFLTGLWAQEIARRQRASVEEAFLCGLLLDVGTPLLLQVASDRLPNAHARRDEVLEVVAERHPSAGAELCRRWRLSERIATALEHHHHDALGIVIDSPTLALVGSLIDIVVLADALADLSVTDIDNDGIVARVGEHPASMRLNLYGDDILSIVERKATLLATSSAVGALPDRRTS